MRHIIFCFIFACLTHIVFGQDTKPYILVLGVAQDGGYPHTGCEKKCCAPVWKDASKGRFVTSLALVDPISKKWWLFEATPDIKRQLHYFHSLSKGLHNYLPEGIFLTHAHIGHYAGLIDLGREVMNTKELPVYAMPRMKEYLETNGPWSQLVKLHNIAINPLQNNLAITLPDGITVTPIKVPHRDEYSETVGYSISTGTTRYLFIPDINKWEQWDRSIVEEVKKVDIALLDATFYDNGELPTRNIKEILHPLVTETMALFDSTDATTRAKVHFIHINHTNPMMWDNNSRGAIKKKGYQIAEQREKL